MPNRLANETSPYLLQHKDNPVDWYPWSDEAFAKARAEDKPVLLSVGYSACHWCHVMEHESFENNAIAAQMNDGFVSIKVDREERPDIDSIYMSAVQSMTGRGGWPMTVFLTPEGMPFYGGTYYPPEDRGGMPGFPRLLTAVLDAYRNRRSDLEEQAGRIVEAISRSTTLQAADGELNDDVLHTAYAAIERSYDPEFGGFGNAPKFPQAMTLSFLARYYHRTKNARALEMMKHTLRAMASGGMYDQAGGGFHRYSTDAVWLVPHFEKMLYDNALLSRSYLDAYRLTGDAFYRRICIETLEYILREMTHESGAFYSTQDADSEGEEGKFFLWTPAEFASVLGDDADEMAAYYDVTEAGNFEGKNILHVSMRPGASEPDAAKILRAKDLLYAAREQRVHPGLDDKVLSGWNGMMLRSFAEAALYLDEPRYCDAAVRNADFLLSSMRPSGRLLRTWKPALSAAEGPGVAKINGYLEDYAAVIDGLLATYSATFELRFLRSAKELADEMIDLFWDDAIQGFYDTGRDQETLITRPRDFFDNATPAGTSMAVDVLLRLALLTGNENYEARATTCLGTLAPYVQQAATAF
ncbi:MAG: thioredoxin domain-containing protein, partial [Dehalococcoidia bacterium]